MFGNCSKSVSFEVELEKAKSKESLMGKNEKV